MHSLGRGAFDLQHKTATVTGRLIMQHIIVFFSVFMIVGG